MVSLLQSFLRSISRRPWPMLLFSLLLCLPALVSVRGLGVNTDIVRLLPDSSPAASWTRKLSGVVGDGGFFTILFKGNDQAVLQQAVTAAANRLEGLPAIASVSYTHPREFIASYRYLLIPATYLEKILDYLLSIKAELNPFTADLLAEPEQPERKGARSELFEMKRLFASYASQTRYHQNEEGTIFGIFIRPQPGMTRIAQQHSLLGDIEAISHEIAERYGIWSGVGGSQLNNLREYEIIMADLARSTLITLPAIVLTLIICFRSLTVLPVLLVPLSVGLLWGFALVPPVVGDLNLITSFLLLIMFGLGVDFSIHLVRRFQQELVSGNIEEALLATYLSCGRSVFISATTTGLALLVLAFSDFRGFSEFGLIGGSNILVLLLAMFLVMPSCLVLGTRWRLLCPARPSLSRRQVMLPLALPVCLTLLLLSLLAAPFFLRFDYNFNDLKPKIAGDELFDSYNKEVYRTRYLSPGAVYLAPSLEGVDQLLAGIENRMRQPDTTFLKTTSVRTFVPSEAEATVRLRLVAQIGQELAGTWVEKITDPFLADWVRDYRSWNPPSSCPTLAELPGELKKALLLPGSTESYLVGLYPNVSRGNGRNAMAFTSEMYGLQAGEGIEGPVGEMPVFAEILWTVTREGPWVVLASFAAIFVLIFLGSRRFGPTLMMSLPLLAGLVLTTGVMSLTGVKLNFFNVVILPALIGMGVDGGVHLFNRWRELAGDSGQAVRELIGPLSYCTLTTMMGYSGMVFAHHPGLRSIGILACLGLLAIWLATVVAFPALLHRLSSFSRLLQS